MAVTVRVRNQTQDCLVPSPAFVPLFQQLPTTSMGKQALLGQTVLFLRSGGGVGRVETDGMVGDFLVRPDDNRILSKDHSRM